MSQILINAYLAELDRIRKFSGSLGLCCTNREGFPT